MQINSTQPPASDPVPFGQAQGLYADGTQGPQGRKAEDGRFKLLGQAQDGSQPKDKAQVAKKGDSVQLSPEAQREVEKLKARDQQVRAHEQAHLAAAGGLARGGASFTYQRGPDGKTYAVGGEVSLDTSPVADNPQATLAKAQQIQAAALAPADPSGQDRAVAAQAANMAAQAASELAQQRMKQASTSVSAMKTGSSAYKKNANSDMPTIAGRLDMLA